VYGGGWGKAFGYFTSATNEHGPRIDRFPLNVRWYPASLSAPDNWVRNNVIVYKS